MSDEAALGTIRASLSVSRLEKGRFRREFRAAFDAIDSVHRSPRIKPIPIVVKNNDAHNGIYLYEGGTGKPERIEISRGGETPALTLVHEISHMIENVFLPGSPYGDRQWASDGLVGGWRSAVKASDPVQRLFAIREAGLASIRKTDGTREDRPNNPGYVEYICSDDELWGRSYAQYIATRSGSDVLLQQLNLLTSPAATYPLQWDDVAFGPIATEFDALFHKTGWRP